MLFYVVNARAVAWRAWVPTRSTCVRRRAKGGRIVRASLYYLYRMFGKPKDGGEHDISPPPPAESFFHSESPDRFADGDTSSTSGPMAGEMPCGIVGETTAASAAVAAEES